jgi:hypothetical protein
LHDLIERAIEAIRADGDRRRHLRLVTDGEKGGDE